MASSLTPNLKLRVNDDLTADAKYNLNRIDSLGSITKVENNANVRIRSARDIIISPQSEDLGGDSSTGQVFIGEAGLSIALLSVFATEIDFNDAVISNFSFPDGFITDSMISETAEIDASKIADGSVSNTEFQYLDGVTSNIQTQIDNLSGANQLAATWLNADGTVKTITHGFNTRNISVQVLDASNNYMNIDVDSITRPNNNDITLTASEAPSTSWVVLLQQIG